MEPGDPLTMFTRTCQFSNSSDRSLYSTLTCFCFFKIHINIILPSSRKPSTFPFPFSFFPSKFFMQFFFAVMSISLHKIKYDWHFCHRYSGPSLTNLIFGSYIIRDAVFNNMHLPPCRNWYHEKRIVPKLIKNFTSFYGTRGSLTMFTRTRKPSLSSAKSFFLSSF
jgi:hypothetical protein